MGDDRLDKVKESSVYPDDLMEEISRSTLGRTFAISVVIHVGLILLTSVGYIGLCLKYNTLDPRAMVEAQEKTAETAGQEGADTGEEAAAKTDNRTTAEPEETGAESEKSPIEQTLEEVSTDLPEDTDISFDDVDQLEE